MLCSLDVHTTLQSRTKMKIDLNLNYIRGSNCNTQRHTYFFRGCATITEDEKQHLVTTNIPS